MPDDRRTQNVTLGCGTLILIALIVSFFSHPGISRLEGDVRRLQSEVVELRKAVQSRTMEIQRLSDKVGEVPRGKEKAK